MIIKDLLALRGARLNEAEQVVGDENVDVHYSDSGFGQFGKMVIFDQPGAGCAMLAQMLGVPPNWQLVKIKQGLWAAYNDADRLVFFSNENDFEEDEEEEEADIEDLVDDDHPESKLIKDKIAARKKAAEERAKKK